MQVVAVLPNGFEHFEEITTLSINTCENVCRNAVRKVGLTTPRKSPVQVKVDMFRLEINEGKLIRRQLKSVSITPQLERMTKDEYREELIEILMEIPGEFRSYVDTESYEQGHSSGYEECVNIARSMVDSLRPCIESYAHRLSR